MEKIDYEGWKNCVRLTNGTVELVVLTEVGPRIIHYGFIGGPNAFQIIPESKGKTGGDTFTGYGGHRLWHAPEAIPRTYTVDNSPVTVAEMDGGVFHVGNAADKVAGIQKDMFISFAESPTGVKVVHRLTNHNMWPISISVWALTIVANGGYVVLPQEPFVSHDDNLLPARPLVLWKFTDMADPRWRWGSKYITLTQDATEGLPQKVGAYVSQGWGAHVTPEQTFIIQIQPDPDGPKAMPDEGCNFETYTDGPFQELETLGRMVTLEPGQSADHVEYWALSKTGGIQNDDASLDERLLPIVAEAVKLAPTLLK